METQLTKTINEEKPISSETKPTDISQKSEEMPTESKELISRDTNKIKQNPMREIEIEKMVLNCGGIGDKLEKSIKLLEIVTKRKIQRLKSTKRIPAFAIAPGKESGCKVTIRGQEKIKNLLKRFFAVLENEISEKKITENHFAFGIPEYIEIPGLEYNRDVGILGFEVDVVFKRKGKRVKMKKIKRGKYPKKQNVTKQEIIDYLIKNFEMEIIQNDSK